MPVNLNHVRQNWSIWHANEKIALKLESPDVNEACGKEEDYRVEEE